tara:strand:+ start:17121 stop:18050 length:930 start_codon:yes stop_codon:yes gene_type:complete
LNIVLTETDVEFRAELKAAFELDGHSVFEASDGHQALALIRAAKPNLIVSEVSLPDMKGDALFEKVKQLGVDYGVIPFIFLSASTTESHKVERLNGGADGVFEKPVNFPLLRAHANACLSNSRRHANLIEAKLENFSRSLLTGSKSNFDHLSPLGDNIDQYLANFKDLIGELVNHANAKTLPAAAAQTIDTSRLQPLTYIRFCLAELDRRREIVSTLNSEALTWWLIFTVAESEYSGEPVFVSDLYYSTPSAKTTINSRMNQLIEKGVLAKRSHSSDGRRQQLIMTDHFKVKFSKHINESIDMLRSELP